VRRVRVCRYENVAWCVVEKRKASLKVIDGMRVLLASSEEEPVGRHGRQAVCVHQVHTMAVLAGTPGPAGTSGCMARREMRGESYRAGLQHCSVFEGRYREDAINRDDDAELRIIARDNPLLHDISRPLARHDASTSQLLEFRDASGVIKVGVRVDD